MHDNSVCFNFFYYIPYKVHKKQINSYWRFQMSCSCQTNLAMAGPTKDTAH